MIIHKLTIQAGTSTASLEVTLWEASPELKLSCRPLVLICPGGGYEMTSDREADPPAMQFLAMGCHTAVLRYSTSPEVTFPAALLELAASVKTIRENAKDWLVNESAILVCGFSAGGHLAASLGVFWNREFLTKELSCKSGDIQPNGLILCYPVITSGPYAHAGSFEALLGEEKKALLAEMSLETQVSKDTPKTFLWHTNEDDAVPAENSLLFYKALRENGVPAEYHVFQNGMHGLSLGNALSQAPDGYGMDPQVSLWPLLVRGWIKANYLS